LALASFALFASGARAAEKLDCGSQSLSQAELDMCAGRGFKIADTKLNMLYNLLLSKYERNNAAVLKTAERAWIAYREAECAYETNESIGGTINPMVTSICATDKTNARIKELTRQLNCQEGDLSCNPPDK
jgi:uncharacterized protein YecT (DUF1311 family)